MTYNPIAMFTAQKVYRMLGNETLWQAAKQCHEILAAAEVPHAVMGGVAVCLHGYQRNTVDVDVLVRGEDSDAIRQSLEDADYRWDAKNKEFKSPSGVLSRFLLAGELAGKSAEVKLPDPTDDGVTTEIEDLPVLRLSKLIESKIACGLGNVRRTHRDFADVVELIIQNRLNSSFARYLHRSLRATYRELVRRSRGTA
jgi:hypothetical protein